MKKFTEKINTVIETHKKHLVKHKKVHDLAHCHHCKQPHSLLPISPMFTGDYRTMMHPSMIGYSPYYGICPTHNLPISITIKDDDKDKDDNKDTTSDTINSVSTDNSSDMSADTISEAIHLSLKEAKVIGKSLNVVPSEEAIGTFVNDVLMDFNHTTNVIIDTLNEKHNIKLKLESKDNTHKTFSDGNVKVVFDYNISAPDIGEIAKKTSMTLDATMKYKVLVDGNEKLSGDVFKANDLFFFLKKGDDKVKLDTQHTRDNTSKVLSKLDSIKI